MGSTGLTWLIAGTLLLDVAMQSGMIANQIRIYALSDTARSRLNTAYMTCAYLGGAAGSFLGVHAFARFGWGAVCLLVAVLALVPTVALLRRAHALARQQRDRPDPAVALPSSRQLVGTRTSGSLSGFPSGPIR